MNIHESKLFVTKTEFNPELLYGGVVIRVTGSLSDLTFVSGNYVVVENTGDTLTLVGYGNHLDKEHRLKIDMEDIEFGHLRIRIIAGSFNVEELKFRVCER